MNNSGEAVRALSDYYQIPPERIIILHDDIDVDFGVLRIRPTGGHGGQNGMRSILHHMGTKDMIRVKMGVGRPPGKMRPSDFVLHDFLPEEINTAQTMIEQAADAVELWLTQDLNTAMSQYNGSVDEPKAPPPPSPEEELALAEQAHTISPGDPKPLEKLARLYKRLNRPDDAVTAHLRLAEIFMAQDKAKRVIAEWERAVKLRPERVDIQTNIAEALEALGDTRRAARRWLMLASHHLERDDNIDAAQQALDRALTLNPEHPKALALQEKLDIRLTS